MTIHRFTKRKNKNNNIGVIETGITRTYLVSIKTFKVITTKVGWIPVPSMC